MSAPFIDVPDDGLVTVRVGGTEHPLDLYLAYNRVCDLGLATEDRPAHEYHAALVDLFAELGLPRLTHRAANLIVAGLRARVDELGKAEAGGPTPGSPGPTAPGSSPSPPEPASNS